MVILIAEDEAMVAFALGWALRTAGDEVLGPAFTVGKALKAGRIRKPDLALVNLVLQGGENGALRAWKLLVQHGTPTIFVSEDIAAARSRQDVAPGRIKKPYDAEMIPSIVWYLDELQHGRVPDRVPPQLEMFRSR